MAKQCGPATFLGTYMDIIGYADDDRALVRMNGVMNKAKWKRHPSFERTREAARYFGAASVIAAGIWGNLPRGLKWIMEGEAYGRLVGACRGLLGKDGNITDPERLLGVELNGWSLPELSPSRALRQAQRGTSGPDERLEMRVSEAAGFDESPSTRLRQAQPISSGTGMKDESRSLLLGRKRKEDRSRSSARAGGLGAGRRKYVMAEPFTDHEDPDFVVEHERLGTIESFREGLRELRAAEALRALEGKPVVRRRRTWVAACEIGSVELVQGHGKKGKFFLEQRGRYWLGKAWSCSEWVCQNQNFQDSQDCLNQNCFSTSRAPLKQTIANNLQDSPNFGMEERIREVVREAALSSEGCEKRTGWFVVIVGTEVAEKRGRHWVRMPYCCGVRVADVVCVEEDLGDSENCVEMHVSGEALRVEGREFYRLVVNGTADKQDGLDCLVTVDSGNVDLAREAVCLENKALMAVSSSFYRSALPGILGLGPPAGEGLLGNGEGELDLVGIRDG